MLRLVVDNTQPSLPAVNPPAPPPKPRVLTEDERAWAEFVGGLFTFQRLLRF